MLVLFLGSLWVSGVVSGSDNIDPVLVGSDQVRSARMDGINLF